MGLFPGARRVAMKPEGAWAVISAAIPAATALFQARAAWANPSCDGGTQHAPFRNRGWYEIYCRRHFRFQPR